SASAPMPTTSATFLTTLPTEHPFTFGQGEMNETIVGEEQRIPVDNPDRWPANPLGLVGDIPAPRLQWGHRLTEKLDEIVIHAAAARLAPLRRCLRVREVRHLDHLPRSCLDHVSDKLAAVGRPPIDRLRFPISQPPIELAHHQYQD